jgi:hypothetical protein
MAHIIRISSCIQVRAMVDARLLTRALRRTTRTRLWLHGTLLPPGSGPTLSRARSSKRCKTYRQVRVCHFSRHRPPTRLRAAVLGGSRAVKAVAQDFTAIFDNLNSENVAAALENGGNLTECVVPSSR